MARQPRGSRLSVQSLARAADMQSPPQRRHGYDAGYYVCMEDGRVSILGIYRVQLLGYTVAVSNKLLRTTTVRGSELQNVPGSGRGALAPCQVWACLIILGFAVKFTNSLYHRHAIHTIRRQPWLSHPLLLSQLRTPSTVCCKRQMYVCQSRATQR